MKYSCVLLLVCLSGIVKTGAQSNDLVDSLKRDPAYIIEDNILIRTKDGASISAWSMRSKNAKEKLTTIFQFTIYAKQTDIRKMKEAADKGYAGVMAYTRGKRYSDDDVIPYEFDGRDANEVIGWITKQEWSDQRVGMYGGSYNGFTQWAATKQLHPALKTIVTSASCAPGLDVPMTNNVVMSFVFPWTYYVSNNKFLDEVDYRKQQWDDLYFDWFAKGAVYSALDTLAGRPGNRIFNRWLAHPTYDSYWQSMIPYKEEFSKITIPVLSTTGYFDGGQIGELYYYREHLKYRPDAEHYLIIGPYGHFGSQGYPDSVYNRYRIDPVANIPIHDIIYEWFDYIFKGKPKPALLKNKVNVQPMGSNEWKHAATLDALSNDTLAFYLAGSKKGDKYGLTQKQPASTAFLKQRIDFADRKTRNSYYYLNSVIYDSLFPNNGLLLTSDPLKEDIEMNGSFSGDLHIAINKKDMDFSVVLMEQMPDGKYFYLSYFMGRASYAKDIRHRNLLTPGKKESLPFRNSYMTSRRIGKGSRLVIILNVNKSPFEQINYGTGKDVNMESISDAGQPLDIKWFLDSKIYIPVYRHK